MNAVLAALPGGVAALGALLLLRGPRPSLCVTSSRRLRAGSSRRLHAHRRAVCSMAWLSHARRALPHRRHENICEVPDSIIGFHTVFQQQRTRARPACRCPCVYWPRSDPSRSLDTSSWLSRSTVLDHNLSATKRPPWARMFRGLRASSWTGLRCRCTFPPHILSAS